MSQWARETAPELKIEHARNSGPLNDEECPWDTPNFHGTGRFAAWGDGTALAEAVLLVRSSDFFRTYDVTRQLSIPTTLDRIATILGAFNDVAPGAVLNCEDEVYMAAVLGCSMGVMRHQTAASVEPEPGDLLHVNRRLDEVTRAVRWQRIAPPVRAGETRLLSSGEILEDRIVFLRGTTWTNWLLGRPVVQAAPARLARGLALPSVDCQGPAPYVAVSLNPNGALAVGTFPRVVDGHIDYQRPKVTVDIPDWKRPVGVFGHFEMLSLRAQHVLPALRVLAQDLAGETAVDITSRVGWNDSTLSISGTVIDEVGLRNGNRGR